MTHRHLSGFIHCSTYLPSVRILSAFASRIISTFQFDIHFLLSDQDGQMSTYNLHDGRFCLFNYMGSMVRHCRNSSSNLPGSIGIQSPSTSVICHTINFAFKFCSTDIIRMERQTPDDGHSRRKSVFQRGSFPSLSPSPNEIPNFTTTYGGLQH